MRKAIAYILLAVVVIGGGCVGVLSEHLTPAKNDERVIAVVEEAGTGKAEDYKGLLFPSLATLRELKHDFETAVVLSDQEMRHLAEKKKLRDDILRGIVASDEKLGEERHEALFDPVTGAVAIGLSLFTGVGAGYLGLMRKRPQDITPEDMEKALAEVKSEVTDKDRKIIQLVNSVKKVIDSQPNKQAQEDIKKILKDNQLPDVRSAVKIALAQL